MTIAQLAKVELHLHLEGAAPPEFIRQLAHEKKLISAVSSPRMAAMFLVISPSFWRSMRRRRRCCKALKAFAGCDCGGVGGMCR